MKIDNPVLPEAIVKRMIAARTSNKFLTLFVPWGVRPEGKPRLESQVMERIDNIKNILQTRGINSQVLVMPADLYATEVNNQVSVPRAAKYFEYITDLAKGFRYEVKPWSEIRAENQGYYNARKGTLTDIEIEKLLPYSTILECLEAAKRRSGYKLEQLVRKSAFAYMRERIIEAEIIEGQYEPIKVSAVGKFKDNNVDRNLPRIYVIPPEQQFPWLK